MSFENKTLGDGIKMVRQKEGLTQLQLSEKLGVSQAYIHACEKGNVGYKNFLKILNKLGYTFEIYIKKIEEVHI